MSIFQDPEKLEAVQEQNRPLVLGLSVLILISAFIPFIMNYKINDHHLNWLNHDYGKNLMMSTEQNSILMTEGGDNQVFSTLYFTYAEKIRPDLTPYDQKGNIFKRIYWDMRYIYPQTLQRRAQLVDAGLFSGEEPFYPDRSEATGTSDAELLKFFQQDPYFIPYWMGTRPVYLTWQRPEPWTLGDYYYKRYGIMYKVQDIEYSLVDYLEIKKDISLAEAGKYLADQLRRSLSGTYISQKLDKLQKEGWISLSADRVRFVRMYPAPHPEDYFASFLLRWREVPNAKYWDYLTREIIINYDYQLGNIYLEKARELKQLARTESRTEIRKDIENKVQENWELAKSYYQDAVTFGGDSISSLHNVAVIYLNNEMEDLSAQALPLLQKGLDLYPNSIGTYQLMFNYLLRNLFDTPANEPGNIQEMEKYLKVLKKQLGLYKGTGGDHTKHGNWKNFAGIENFIVGLKQFPNSQLMQLDANLARQIESNPAQVQTMAAQQVIFHLFQRGISVNYQPYLDKARSYMIRLIPAKAGDAEFLGWAFEQSIQLQEYDMALYAGLQFEKLKTEHPRLKSLFNYYMGKLFYAQGGTQQAARYFQAFLDSTRGNMQAQMQQKSMLDESRQVLDQLQGQPLRSYTPRLPQYRAN